MLITGGGGFLGSHLVDRVRRDGIEPFVARRRDYDLTEAGDVARLFDDARSPSSSSISRRRSAASARTAANPGRYWYSNLMMGAHVLEQSRVAGARKVVLLGTICSYPKFAPVPFREEDLWNGYPEETNAPYGVAKKALLVGAQGYREQYGLDAVYLLPVNLYGPRDNFDLETSHVIPALIRKMIEAQERGEPRGRPLGRRVADARVPLRRRLRRGHLARRPALRRRRAREPRHRRGDLDPRAGGARSRELTGYDGDDRLGHDEAERPAATQARRLARRASASASARSTTLRDGLEAHDRLVPRAPRPRRRRPR